MVEKIIGATIVPSLQEFDWISQIGWLVKPWTKRIQTGDDQFNDLIIPVAANVTDGACEVQEYGMHVLTTDKGYEVLVLIEQLGDMISETAENIPQRRAINISQDISINVWTRNTFGRAHIAKSEIIKALFKAIYRNVEVTWGVNGVADPDYSLYINKLKTKFVRETSGNPFAEYSFSKDQAQFMNNYSAFGLVFNLSGLIFPDCAPEYPEFDTECDQISTDFTVTIQEQFNSESACIGGEILMNGTVTGGYGAPSYQWFELINDNWVEIEGATSIQYTKEADDPEGVRSYQLFVTKSGITEGSNILQIAFVEQPNAYIIATPSSITTDGSATLSSEVLGGIGGNNYQWEYFTEGDWEAISGATDSEYVVNGSEYGAGDHLFRLHVTQESATCEAFSSTVTVTITAP